MTKLGEPLNEFEVNVSSFINDIFFIFSMFITCTIHLFFQVNEMIREADKDNDGQINYKGTVDIISRI